MEEGLWDEIYTISHDEQFRVLPHASIAAIGDLLFDSLDEVAQKLGMAKDLPQYKMYPHPGAKLLQNWSLRRDTTIRLLYSIFKDLKRNDLIEKLEYFLWDFNNYVVVLENGVGKKSNHDLEKIPSRVPLREVLEQVIMEEYKKPLSSFEVKVNGKKNWESKKCSEYTGTEIHVVINDPENVENLPGYENISREVAISKLKDGKYGTGAYLIRKKTGEEQFVVSAKYENIVLHFLIHHSVDENGLKKYFFFDDGEHCTSIKSLLDFYSKQPFKTETDQIPEFCLKKPVELK